MDPTVEVDLITVAGYECPAITSKPAKLVLRQLKKHGVVEIECDDGPSLLLVGELKEIAEAIGIDYYVDSFISVSHRLLLIDRCKKIDATRYFI